MNFQPNTTNYSPMDRRSVLAKVLDTNSTYKRFSGLGIRYHDIQKEDTMESVCNQYGITESALREANFGMRKTLSSGNKRIIIPAREKNQECKEQDVRDDSSSVRSHIDLVTSSISLVAI